MRRYTRIAVGITIIVGIGACTPTGAPPTIETVVPPPLSTPLPTAFPVTPAPTAVQTAPPTETPIGAAPPTRTMDPTPVLRSPPDKRWPSTSPDGAWQAVGELYLPGDEGGLYYTRLIVQAVDGSQEWIVVDEWAALALGYTAPRPLRWSADGRYLYYTNVPVPDGCGLFANGSDLQRVDLSSGEVTELVPSVGMRLALSPDEASLAYVGYGDQGLVLRDIASGLEREVPLEVLGAATSAAAGAMVWSPDGSTLLLTVALQPCFPQQVHTIVRVDVGTLAQETLVEADARLLITVEWLEVKEVRLEDSAGQTWWLDPWTGAVYREK